MKATSRKRKSRPLESKTSSKADLNKDVVKATEAELALFLNFAKDQQNSAYAVDAHPRKKKMKSPKPARIERTISSTFLPSECVSTFRVTLSTDSELLDDFVWQRIQDDLRVIGFLKDCGTNPKQGSGEGKIKEKPGVFNSLIPLSLTSRCNCGKLYKPIFKHLPPLFSCRLTILRLIGHLVYTRKNDNARETEHLKFKAMKAPVIERVVRFFQDTITTVLPESDRFPVLTTSKTRSNMKRIRLDLTPFGQTSLSIKTWQPTLCEDYIGAIVSSCRAILQPKVSFRAPQSSYIVEKNPTTEFHCFKNSPHKKASPLCEHAWEDVSSGKTSITQARLAMVHMLCNNIELCAVFCLKQMWGLGKLFEMQCQKIWSYVEEESAKNDAT